MEGIFSIKGIWIEIIEIFGELLVIQEIISKAIRTIFYYELDQADDNSKIKEESNIYSLRGWTECQKELAKTKQKAEPDTRPKQRSKPLPFLKLLRT